MLDGLLVPTTLGPSRDRVLAVVAHEMGFGLGDVHEDAGQQIAGRIFLKHLGARMLGAC